MNGKADTVLINLFGTACTLAAGYISNDVKKMLLDYKNTNRISLEEVVSDYKHLHWLEIDKVRKWQDFGTLFFASGLYENVYS